MEVKFEHVIQCILLNTLIVHTAVYQLVKYI